MDDVEIVTRVERRRKWTHEERAALLAEIKAEGGRVTIVARRHKISESLLYNWRSAQKAAFSLAHPAKPMEFLPIGVFGPAGDKNAGVPEREQPRDHAGLIEIDQPVNSHPIPALTQF